MHIKWLMRSYFQNTCPFTSYKFSFIPSLSDQSILLRHSHVARTVRCVVICSALTLPFSKAQGSPYVCCHLLAIYTCKVCPFWFVQYKEGLGMTSTVLYSLYKGKGFTGNLEYQVTDAYRDREDIMSLLSSPSRASLWILIIGFENKAWLYGQEAFESRGYRK